MKMTNLKSANITSAAPAFAMCALPVYAADNQGRAIDAENAFHLIGVNTFSGTGDRATSLHKHTGQNACIGQELQNDKAGECLTKGGTIGNFG